MGDEGHRFLRYVMPSLVYGIETLFFLFIVFPESTVSVLSNAILSKDSFKDNLGTIVGLLLASGGLGYIFAAIHHWVHWHLPFSKFFNFEEGIFNHQSVIKELRDKQLIQLDPKVEVLLDSTDKTLRRKARETAESISLAHWYRLLKDENRLGTDAIDSLCSHAHALGTARIASFFALLTALLFILWAMLNKTLELTHCPVLRYVVMLITGGGITFIFHDSYRRVALFAQKAYDETLTMLLLSNLSNQAIAVSKSSHKNGDENGPN